MEILGTEELWTRDQVLAEIRENYQLALLCILPTIESRVHKLKSSAKSLDIDSTQFEVYKKMLLESSIWKIKGKTMFANFELLDLGDLSIQNHMAMTINIISKLSTEKSSEYESLSLSTNRKLIKSFVGKVRKALKELYDESSSESEEKEVLFSWNQTGVIEVEKQKEKDESESYEN